MTEDVLVDAVAYGQPWDPQRICASCRAGTFFVTYADRLLSLLCVNCRRPVLVPLERQGWQVLISNTIEKGD